MLIRDQNHKINQNQEIPLDVTVTTSQVANGLQITPQGIILTCEIPENGLKSYETKLFEKLNRLSKFSTLKMFQ